MNLGNQIQIVLLVFYVILAGIFFKQNQWPVAVYYVGCLVKDLAVFVLAFLEKK